MSESLPESQDHLDAMYFGGEGNGGGRYTPEGLWDVSPAGPATSAAARTVSLHEMMHAQLNDCTAWGSLMKAYAALARYADDRAGYRDVGRNILRASRRVHEVFATYTGTWMADRAQPMELLAGRPEYLDYYLDASWLAAGLPRGSQLEWKVIVGSVRTCMQSRGLPAGLEIGLDRFKLADIRSRDQPDVRFGLLLDAAEQLWPDLIEEIAGQFEPTERKTAVTWLTAPDADYPAGDTEFEDRVAATAEKICFDRSAAALRDRGAEVLGYNEHQDFTEEIVAAVHRLAPAATAFRAAPADSAEVNTAMEDFALERLRIRQHPLPARVMRLADIPARTRSQVVGRTDPAGSYAFLVARSANSLASQHDISDQSQPLPAEATAPVVAVRTLSGTPEHPVLWLWQLARPGQLRALRRRIGGLGVISNVSMSLLADERWEDRWLSPLLAAGSVTILMDLNPFVHFQQWASLGLRVRYATLEARSETGSTIGLVCACDKPGTALRYDGAIFLAICSDVQASAIIFVLRQRWPDLARLDQDIIAQRLDVLRITLNHLLTEEASFTFLGPHAAD